MHGLGRRKSAIRDRLSDPFYDYFQQGGHRPGRFLSLILEFVFVVSGQGEIRRAELRRRLRALRTPIEPLLDPNPTEIELLIVAAPKDFEVLPLSIASAIENAGHPVTSVTLIVPADGMSEPTSLIDVFRERCQVSVLCEDSVIDDQIRRVLKERFGDRYGWILQQLLTTAYVAGSSQKGVLVLDADTLLLKPRVLLSDGRQILTPTLSHHLPYYEFLHVLSPIFDEETDTYVSHYMLFQPEVMREILDRAGDLDIAKLAEMAVKLSDPTTQSPVCLEFELYAQGLISLHPHRVVHAKWGNTSASREKVLGKMSLRDIMNRYEGYSSLSLHSWM